MKQTSVLIAAQNVCILQSQQKPSQALCTNLMRAAGLYSLGAVELRNSLEGSLQLQLPGTLVFDYPSISAISQYIASTTGAATASEWNGDGPLGAAGDGHGQVRGGDLRGCLEMCAIRLI